jgi:FkbM family methyltransferase
VLAVEPVPANHALLAENVQLNNLQTLVKVFRMAIWSSSCERSLNVADDSTGGSGFYYGKETAPAIPVRCIQLGELMDAEGVTTCDLLKLDCEGAEFEILNSLSQATWRRIDAIVMEYHLFAGYSLEQLWDCLTRQGFLVAVKPLEHVEGILGYVLAVRPSMPSLYQMSVTQAESPLTRLPIVGRLWRVARRPVHRLVVFYLNQLIAAYDRHQRRTYICLRLLSYQAAQRDGVIHHHRQQRESDSGIGER